MQTGAYLQVSFGDLEKSMEGSFRPGHFNGVVKVVAKLFHIVEPDTAYFGQKDWQQFVIIRTLVEELKFNVKLSVVETVREADGLALSSRNQRLTDSQRKQAVVLSATLNESRQKLLAGDSIAGIKGLARNKFEAQAGLALEYLEVVNSENLLPLKSVEEADRPILCIAAFVDEVRLIDNMFL